MLKLQYNNEYRRIYEELAGLSNLRDYPWVEKSLHKNFSSLRGVWRHSFVDLLKRDVLIGKSKYILTVFKITRLKNGIKASAHYALLFSTVDGNSKIKHERVCMGTTYRSADGEYRNGFVGFSQIEATKTGFKKVYEKIDDYTSKIIKNKEVILSYESFGASKEIIEKVESSIEDERIGMLLYNSTIVSKISQVYYGTIENHILDNYYDILFDRKKYISLIEDAFDFKNDPEYMHTVSKYTTLVIKNGQQDGSPILTCGIKMIPLTIGDVENIGDVKYQSWLEPYISKMVSDLVLNIITPSFPLFKGFMFVNSTDPDMYDNLNIRTKILQSEKVKIIANQLENVRKNTYHNVKGKIIFDNRKMENLSENIEISIDYIENEMYISDYSIVNVTEFVGSTFGDIDSLLKRNAMFGGLGDILNNVDVFARYLFDYVYGLYCLNSRLNVIHGDLHLNNVTLGEIIVLSVMDERKKGYVPVRDMTFIVYEIDDFYILPHYGRYGFIIDFSRAIHSNNNGATRKKIINIFEDEMPEFYSQYANKIQVLAIENYDLFFKIMTAIDMYKLSTSMIAFLEEKHVSEEIIAFLLKIKKITEYVLKETLLQAINGIIKDIDYPNKQIIDRVFEPYLLKNFEQKKVDYSTLMLFDEPIVADFYSYKNEIKYHIDKEETLPPTLSWDLPKKFNIEAEEARKVRFDEYDNAPENISMEKIKETEKQNKAARRGTNSLIPKCFKID